MSREKAKNLLERVVLSDVLAAALTPGAVPAAGLKPGQTQTLPDGSKYAVLPTDYCVEPDTWDRPETIRESVEKLKPSLASEAARNDTAYGNHDAIIVQGKAPRYEILSGKSRWIASKELGLMVLAKVLGKPLEGIEQKLFEVLMNRGRTDLSNYETVKAAVTLENAGAKKALIAKALHRTERAVYSYLQVAKNPELMKKIASGEVTFTDAQNSLTLQKKLALDDQGKIQADQVAAVLKKKATYSGGIIDQGPLRFVIYDTKRQVISLTLRLKDATKSDKKKALKISQDMVERLNNELNPTDPRKTDRRKKEAVTPSQRRKVDKD